MSEVKAAWTNEDNFSIETTASDCIKREDAIKANENYVPYQRLGEDRQLYMDRILKELPSADVVEVVRCKDCKHKVVTVDGEWNPEDIVCDYWQSDGLTDNDYCSQGKRGEQEHE